LFVTLVMMLAPLQLPSVHHKPFCDGCAREPEENTLYGVWSTKHSQGKTERRLYLLIS